MFEIYLFDMFFNFANGCFIGKNNYVQYIFYPSLSYLLSNSNRRPFTIKEPPSMNANLLHVDTWVFDYVHEYLEWHNIINDFPLHVNSTSVIHAMVCWVVRLLQKYLSILYTFLKLPMNLPFHRWSKLNQFKTHNLSINSLSTDSWFANILFINND